VRAPTLTHRQLRRVGTAGLVGTTIEYFDFSVYGFLALYFAPLFFPSQNPTAAVLSALAVFGSAYVVRPLGGAFFGALGDRVGRRPVLLITLLTMGTASMLIGLLPTYATIGVAAPILLVLLRLVQGFSAGGENMGALTYVVESAPRERRAVYGALIPAGSGLGFAFAALVVAVVSAVVPTGELATWGWRIPFLVCAPLTLFCLWLRLRLEDSPTFRAVSDRSETTRTPVRTAISGHWRNILRVAALSLAVTAPGFLGMVYLSTFLLQTKQLAPTAIYLTTAVVLVLSVLAYPASGLLAERFGRGPVMIAGAIGYIAISYPFMALIDAADSMLTIGVVFLAFMALYAVPSGPAFATMAELFPTTVRYTSAALGYNIGIVVAGGLGPYLSAQLVASTGNNLTPAFWVMGACAVGLVVMISTPETARDELT
jgi:MHS family proline/betaine transporter-like MFS transporter